jgi:NADH-quinone oxidoreductase subunit G
MSDIHLTIDGIPLTVPAGTNLVDAARMVDIAIPVFCYHPRMQPVGMCRMCLVAVGTPRIDRETRKMVLKDDGTPEIAMMPKLQTGCTTIVSEGMVVYTSTEEVKFAQNGVLEFLLTSHPLDCPVCDKGGECPLQNLTMGWGPGNSRFDYSDKVHFVKPVPLGDLILLDRERCILCGRCVRYQEELVDDPVLGYATRGRNWHIISKSDPPFDSKFSGNTTDICPVGALTTVDFRFKARAWELQPMPSICNHCPVGCNIALDMRYNNLMRVMPRENSAVNDIWICDKGRFAMRFVESGERLTTPLIRRGDHFEQATWDEALEIVAEKVAALHRAAGGEALAGLADDRLANEDLYLFQKLFREVLESNNLDHRAGAPGDPPDDDIGAYLGVGSGTNLMHLGKGTTVLLVGADPEEEAPLYRLRLRAIAERGGELLVINPRPTRLDHSASMCLHYRPGTDIQVVRALLSLVLEAVGTRNLTTTTSGLPELRAALNNVPIGAAASAAGLREDDLREVVRRFTEAENGIIVYGSDALLAGEALTQDLGSIAVVAGKVGKPDNGLIPLLRRGNSRGALDMGVRPDKGPGYTPLRERGLSAREMWGAAIEQRIKGMYIAGLDPVSDYPASQDALAALEFLVVQDMFMTPTAQRAHVVLPAAAFAEGDGTFTNVERRVQRARRAREAPGECRPHWSILQGVGERMLGLLRAYGASAPRQPESEAAKAKESRRSKGKEKAAPAQHASPAALILGWDYLTASDVALEIAERVPGYANITHGSLAKTGRRGTWGRQTNEAIYYDGTNYENTEGVGLQYPAPAEAPKAAFQLKPRPVEPPPTDSRYPFLLMVQPLLYDGDPLLHDSLLQAHIPAPSVALSKADAVKLGIRSGEQVQVASAAGTLTLQARVHADIAEGSVLVPANLPDGLLATIQTGLRTAVAIRKLQPGSQEGA